MCIGCRVRKHVVACQSWWYILRCSAFFLTLPFGNYKAAASTLLFSCWQKSIYDILQTWTSISVFSEKSPKSNVCFCSRHKDRRTQCDGQRRTGWINKTHYCSHYFSRDDKAPLAFLANESLQLKPWSLPNPEKVTYVPKRDGVQFEKI